MHMQRVVTSLLISVFIHIVIFAIPWQNMAGSAWADMQFSMPEREDTLPVALRAVAPPVETPVEDELPEAITIDTEGKHINASYEERMKIKIFNAWDYPLAAQRDGRNGTVRLHYVLDNRGHVLELSVLSSSGHRDLDVAAIVGIEKGAPFGPFTEDMPHRTLPVTINLRYEIDG